MDQSNTTNATGGSSNDTRNPAAEPAEPLNFATAPAAALVLPEGLFDEFAQPAEGPSGLYPPLIVWRDGASLRIVDGCKRWRALTARGTAECICGIIESPFDFRRAALLRIRLNRGRELSAREKYLFIRWLHSNLDHDAYLAESREHRIPPGERHDYEQLLSCRDTLVEAALRGSVDVAVAPEMNHIGEADTQALLALFGSISFSRQMQRELAEWLHEIAFFEKIAIEKLLASGFFAETLADSRLNAPQKAARIHESAHARRFPLYSKTKQAWAEHARAINPDPRAVSFHPTPFFEKRNLEIRIRFANAAAAREILRKLSSIGKEDWEKLIDPTVGLEGDMEAGV